VRPPEPVDRVEVVSLVDNSIDILMAGGQGVKRAPLRSIEWAKEEYLVAEHGFSALIRTLRGKQVHTILFDTGLSPTALVHNAELLDVELDEVETIVLSHGHGDHTGGILGFMERVGRRRLPLILHPHAFRKRRLVLPDGHSISLHPPNRQTLADAGLEIAERKGSSILLDSSVLVTGEIVRRTDFEKGMPIHYAEVEGKLEPDPLVMDDQAIVVSVRGRGLVVITGCGHAGAVNTVKYVQTTTGIEKVHAIIGGLHLTGRIFEPLVPRTVEELKAIRPDVIVPSHCTGWRAAHALSQAFPEAFMQNSVGTTYIFGQ